MSESSPNFRGPFEGTDRNLYSDYSEISPWNTNYQNRFKRASKPTWKYFSGTMPDFHQIIRGHTTLTCEPAFCLFLFYRYTYSIMDNYSVTLSS